jgi:hypothetical protein
MLAAGWPSMKPSRKPSGSASAKAETSSRPGFQPSAAAHDAISSISAGSAVLI